MWIGGEVKATDNMYICCKGRVSPLLALSIPAAELEAELLRLQHQDYKSVLLPQKLCQYFAP